MASAWCISGPAPDVRELLLEPYEQQYDRTDVPDDDHQPAELVGRVEDAQRCDRFRIRRVHRMRHRRVGHDRSRADCAVEEGRAVRMTLDATARSKRLLCAADIVRERP